jgi:HEAT repeat protein
MNLLTIVTATALLLTVLSLVLLLSIIVLRIFTDRNIVHERKFREMALPLILSHIGGKTDLETTLAFLKKEPSLALPLLMQESVTLGKNNTMSLKAVYEALPFAREGLRDVKSHDWATRLHAVDRLGFIDGDASIPALMTALGDDVIAVRFAAARSLVRLECLDAVETILHSLDVPGEVSQRRVAEILFSLGRAAEKPLLKVLENSSVNDTSLTIAIRVAGMLRLEQASLLLRHFLHHQDLNVRLNSVRALASIGERSAITEIAALGEDPSWEVRSAVMQALGELQAEDQIALLLQGISDQEWWVRHNAGEALVRFGDPGIEVLQHGIEHHVDGFGRDMCRQILQQHGLLEATREAHA